MTTTPETTTAAPVGDTDAKAAYIDAVKALLLDQHLNPDTIDGEKPTRMALGVREGRIQTYIEVIQATPGPPQYNVPNDTLRVMLLGQALTDHTTG